MSRGTVMTMTASSLALELPDAAGDVPLRWLMLGGNSCQQPVGSAVWVCSPVAVQFALA
jgi:hypothetical protein